MHDTLKDQTIKNVDIKTDLTFYYVKVSSSFKANKDSKALKFEEPNETVFKCRLSLSNQIKSGAFSICKSSYHYDYYLHNRISAFFKLYTGLLNVGTFFLVSHRNFITLFDLKEGVSSTDCYC